MGDTVVAQVDAIVPGGFEALSTRHVEKRVDLYIKCSPPVPARGARTEELEVEMKRSPARATPGSGIGFFILRPGRGAGSHVPVVYI